MTPKVRMKGKGKRGKLREKYVIKPMFDEYYNLWMAEREKLGIECDYLFVRKDKDGNWAPATVSTANRIASKISKLSGEDFYTHSGRHYFCTLLKAMDYPNDVIMEIIGWDTDMIPVYDDTPSEERLKKYFKKIGVMGSEEAQGGKDNG
jgi:integrase